MTSTPSSRSARDRAIEVVYAAGGAWLKRNSAEAIVDALTACPDVLRELAGVGDRVMDGGQSGTLVRCRECDGSGVLLQLDANASRGTATPAEPTALLARCAEVESDTTNRRMHGGGLLPAMLTTDEIRALLAAVDRG